MMAYSIFDTEYKTVINNILRDIYRGTEYWGVGEAGTEGVVKPITAEDDPEWSNYNFINSHWTVKEDIVIPYLRRLYNVSFEKNRSYKESEINANFFKVLWDVREELFSPDSNLKDDIVRAINKTRKKGNERENYVKLALETLNGVTVETISKPGSVQDFMGTDLIIHSHNPSFNNLTAQVKPFKNLTNDVDNWFVETDALRREYTQNLMIFGKMNGQEYHVAIFKNEPELFVIEEERVIIPKNLIVLLINYNIISKKSKFKSYK